MKIATHDTKEIIVVYYVYLNSTNYNVASINLHTDLE